MKGNRDKQEAAGPVHSSPESSCIIVHLVINTQCSWKKESSNKGYFDFLFQKIFKYGSLVRHSFVIDSIEVLVMLELFQYVLFCFNFGHVFVKFFVIDILFPVFFGTVCTVVYVDFLGGIVLSFGVELWWVEIAACDKEYIFDFGCISSHY